MVPRSLEGERMTGFRDLSHLVEVGLLERHGEKKGTYYTLRS